MSLQNNFDYTRNMETIFQGKLSELKSYYCREDFELALQDAERAAKDSVIFKNNYLKKICNARGIRCEELKADRSLLDQIPTRTQMKDDLLQWFYDMYSSTKSTSAYMERIVRRLAPEYRNDSVRTAILKKFLCGAGENFQRFNTKQIIEWAEARLSESDRARMDSFDANQKKELIISKIDDSIFEREQIELTAVDIVLLIARCAEKYCGNTDLDFTEFMLEESTETRVDDLMRKHGLFQTGRSADEKIRIIADETKNRMLLQKDLLTDAGVIEAVEEDFRNQLKKIKNVSKKTGREGTAADLYTQAKKDALRAKKAEERENNLDFELLDMCSDLAAGNFRVNGKTKVALYYFAFMFDMTVSVNGIACDPQKDVEKNLFHDFYNDNLLRLLSGDYANSDPKIIRSVENEPTGEGINYKNFTEAVYIYFLYRRDLDLKPGERIDYSEFIIGECMKRAKKQSPKSAEQEKLLRGVYTNVYRDCYMSDLLKKNVDEVADYVAKKYSVTSSEKYSIPRIMISSEENTASDGIDRIMKDIEWEYPEMEFWDINQESKQLSQKSKRLKDIKDDIVFKENAVFDSEIKSLLEERFSGDADFLKVIRAINDRLHIMTGRFNASSKKRMLVLLHVLSVYSNADMPISAHLLHRRMERKGIVSAGSQLSNSMAALTDLGFDIKRGTKEDTYYLDCRNYEDASLRDLLERTTNAKYEIHDWDMQLLSEIMIRKLRLKKRVTRSELIALHFNFYITLLDNSEVLDTFPDVYEDYCSMINPYLEEARYQPLSEKNIFDMYLVIAMYFYLVDSNQ